MSHYSRNHLQSDWQREADTAYAERLEAAESEAGHYFARATVIQKTAFDLTMADLRGMEAPRYDRARAEAKRAFAVTTRDANDLYHRSVAEIMADGEITEAMSFAWDALIANPMPTEIAA